MNFFVTLNLFMLYSKLIINGCCLIVFSTYIIYDTQLILGNQREKFNNNDYVLAAMCLYIDIINLFIEMVKIASLNENVDDKDNKDDGLELLLGLKKKYSNEEEDEKDNKKGKEKDSKKKKEKDKKKKKKMIRFNFSICFILF